MKRGLAFAALLIVTAATSVGLPSDQARADLVFPYETASNAGLRIDAAFGVAGRMPLVAVATFPMAQKGDLPIPLGCLGSVGHARAACMDEAYVTGVEGDTVVETRFGNSSSLFRVDAVTVAVAPGEAARPAE